MQSRSHAVTHTMLTLHCPPQDDDNENEDENKDDEDEDEKVRAHALHVCMSACLHVLGSLSLPFRASRRRSGLR